MKEGTTTKWNARQYIAVVCDSTAATTYCDGANQIHRTVGGSLTPSKSDIFIGASYSKTYPLYAGSEICAIRMTAGTLAPWQLEYNNAIDHVRFNGNVTVVNGAVGDTGETGACSVENGVYDVVSGTWTITAGPVKTGGKTYVPRLTVEEFVDGEWRQVSRELTGSYTVAAPVESRRRLAWTWEKRPGLLISIY